MKCWLHNGGNPVCKHPAVLITGDGRSLPEDLATWQSIKVPHDNWAIARSYQRIAAIDHWGMVDAEDNSWWARNGKFDWKGNPQRHTLGDHFGYEFDWDSDQEVFDKRENKWWGSSALFGVLACLHLGYERIVLAGCPLDDKGHWYALPHEITPRIWHERDFQVWRDFKKQAESERVKSLSGFTRVVLGQPSATWLMSSQQ
jgi:hypothetical protein